MKVINNAVAAANTAVAAEALLAGKLAGADLDALVTVMRAGSGASAMLELKAGPMRAHDWSTLFKLEHMLKDLRLCLEEAEAVGARMELVEDTADLLAEAERKGPRGAGLRRAARGGRGALGRAAVERRTLAVERRAAGIGQAAAARAAHEVHDHGREQDRQRDARARHPRPPR